MQEYITLMCIALTGLSGLFIIHDEMRQVSPGEKDFLVLKSGLSSFCPELIRQESHDVPACLQLESQTESMVNFRILGYDPEAGLYISWESDQKLFLTAPCFSISFQSEGKQLVKLMSGQILIDLIEVEIQIQEIPSIIS